LTANVSSPCSPARNHRRKQVSVGGLPPTVGHVNSLHDLLQRTGLDQLDSGHGALSEVYRLLWNVQPVLLLAAAALLYLTLVYLRRNLAAIPAALLLIYLGLLFGSPNGQAIVSNASTRPLLQQPRCLLDATFAGALFSHGKLGNVSACERVDSGKSTGIVTDQANDGVLSGTFDGPHYNAQAHLTGATPPWRALTIAEGGTRVIYFAEGAAAYRLWACPDISGTLPAKVAADTSGHTLTTFFATRVDPSLLSDLFPGAHGFAASADGRFRVISGGNTVGYLLPVAGPNGGRCAFLAPYQQLTVDEWRQVTTPSASDLTELARIAANLRLDGIKAVGG